MSSALARSTSSRRVQSTSPATALITMHLEQAEAEPHRAGEREDALQPCAGLRRLKSGLIRSGTNRKPTCSTFVSTPPSTSSPRIGSTIAGEALHDRVPVEHHRCPGRA